MSFNSWKNPKSQQLYIDAQPASFRKSTAAFPKFLKPEPVGCYSINTQRQYVADTSQLGYLKLPKQKEYPLDLNQGYELAIKKPENYGDNEKLDHLLLCILDNLHELKRQEGNSEHSRVRLEAEFVAFRGLLRKILKTVYEQRDDWCFCVTRFKGTCYIREEETEQKKYQNANQTEMQKRMCAWGLKFEQFCCVGSPEQDADASKPVDECAEFGCMFRSRLNGIPLLYGAEMDAIVSDKPLIINKQIDLMQLKFVELKTRQQHLNPHQQRSYQTHKIRDMYMQCFLVGIEDIYVGMRNPAGLVNKIEKLNVAKLPKEANNFWHPAPCFNFLFQFLQSIKSLMKDIDCPYTTFTFYFDPRDGRHIVCNEFHGKTTHSFLPDWYIKRIQEGK